MKLPFSIFFVFIFQLAEAQVKEFIVIDSRTKVPISAVSAFFSTSNEGSVTNADGKVKVYFVNNTDTLKFSHVGYDPKKILLKDYLKADTIRLTPASILLKEVAIYSMDLKKNSLIFSKTITNYIYLSQLFMIVLTKRA